MKLRIEAHLYFISSHCDSDSEMVENQSRNNNCLDFRI